MTPQQTRASLSSVPTSVFCHRMERLSVDVLTGTNLPPPHLKNASMLRWMVKPLYCGFVEINFSPFRIALWMERWLLKLVQLLNQGSKRFTSGIHYAASLFQV